MDKEVCPVCGVWLVVSYHEDDKWKIGCKKCGLSTHWHNTWRSARREWDRNADIRKHLKGE